MNLSVKNLCDFSSGKLLSGDPNIIINNISTNSRECKKDEAFLAIIGEKFDAHEFIPKLIKKGCKVFIVSDDATQYDITENASIIQVNDTIIALQEIAKNYKNHILKNGSNLKTICITGSNGKTSTKDILNSILSQSNKTTSTYKNFNNHIGLPLSIFKTRPEHQYAIWELGMNHVGEISQLGNIAKPDGAIITNIGSAHIEFFTEHEGKKGIAKEKASLIKHIKTGGFLALHREDDYFDMMSGIAREQGIEVISVSIDFKSKNKVDFFAHKINTSLIPCKNSFEFYHDKQLIKIHHPYPGKHIVINSLLALGVALKLGVSIDDIKSGIEKCKISDGRLSIKKLKDITIIDDTYNANPESMSAGLNLLSSLASSDNSNKIAVLGHMAEIGVTSQIEHFKIGQLAATLDINIIIIVGINAQDLYDGANFQIQNLNHNHKSKIIKYFETHEKALEFIKNIIQLKDVIYIKGSRSAQMEKIITLLKINN